MKGGFWSGRKVLVTGGAGFVGSHLCKALKDLGADWVAGDFRSGPSWRVRELSDDQLVQLDVRSPSQMMRALETSRPEVVFHLAGIGHIREAQERPQVAFDVNVAGVWTLLDATRRCVDLEAVVLASSNHVYGDTRECRVFAAAEQEVIRPRDVYAASKYCADVIAAQPVWGVPVVSLRHVNCYGPADPHESHLVTGTICALLKGQRPVIRGDPFATKGYLHVSDVVSAYLAAAQESCQSGLRGPINAGPDTVTSVLSMVERLQQIAGADLEPDVQHVDHSQDGYLEMLDSSRLRSLTGWRPRLNLDEGLRSTFAWYRDHGGMAWL